jgi:hypothetical protein
VRVCEHACWLSLSQDAGIFDLRNCARWAASGDFLPRHYHVLDSHEVLHGVNEAASTVQKTHIRISASTSTQLFPLDFKESLYEVIMFRMCAHILHKLSESLVRIVGCK